MNVHRTMIQTTYIDGHTYYIVSTRTVTTNKKHAQELALILIQK